MPDSDYPQNLMNKITYNLSLSSCNEQFYDLTIILYNAIRTSDTVEISNYEFMAEGYKHYFFNVYEHGELKIENLLDFVASALQRNVGYNKACEYYLDVMSFAKQNSVYYRNMEL